MIRHEVLTFGVVGGLTALVDFVSYRLFMYVGIGIAVAKALGFITGTGFAYVANRYWTFAHRQPVTRSSAKFGALYGVTLCVNVAVNKLCLEASAPLEVPSVEIAFVVATGCSAILNFLGMRLFVFRAIRPVSEVEK